MAVVEFENVSKSFLQTPGRVLLRSHLERRLRKSGKEIFYALKNVSFQLDHGESLAVVGRNGAGKSTLLSLAVGVARPSEGRIRVHGETSALLELGSGFHPDLTGAENLHLNAALLGFNRKETDRIFDSVVEFSGLGDFIEQPLRTYSSGMILRLAFSIAVSRVPDILVIDEVLAVGDQSFQAKCLDKVFEFRRAGKALLFVSHDAAAVQQICDRALWLDHGEVMMDGPVEEVLEAYSQELPKLASEGLA